MVSYVGRFGALLSALVHHERGRYLARSSSQDNLSCHWTPAIRAWAEQSNVELVPTLTYASYLNRIESHFGAIGEFVVINSDYLHWESFGHAMTAHIRYRNQPKRRHERLARRRTRFSLAA